MWDKLTNFAKCKLVHIKRLYDKRHKARKQLGKIKQKI